ncbi:MAG: histidine phosphatase family protein [Microbacterium sp.]|uniref:histidine phosphatase family protein n=1 Tax=Microbacterium sp. TaxID=51671 RepID=UPI00261FC698|nr:histidine phosphatase family protein [Microbacterium sp.]MCX6502388.1 histidine phosphatase family protein [Microbacterium sp.]
MTRLLLIRHGETDWNRDQRVQGNTDIPLNDTGRRQAKDAAATVAGLLGTDPAVIAASDLSRARETAEIIAADLGLAEPWTTPLLRERSYGEAEGLDLDEFRRRYGRYGHAEPEGAETRDELRARALQGIREAVAETRRRTGPGSNPLIAVAHGGLIREIISHASGGTFPAQGDRIPNASVHELLVERDRLRLVSHAAA